MDRRLERAAERLADAASWRVLRDFERVCRGLDEVHGLKVMTTATCTSLFRRARDIRRNRRRRR